MLGDSSESDYAFTSFFEDLCDEIHAGTQSSAFTVPQRFKDWLLRIVCTDLVLLGSVTV